MAVSINTNINSLRVMRNLSAATHSLSRTYERLASGQRINRASDDAAGLAIADSLRSRSRLYSAANRNINDGISALSIAGSALEQQVAILQRLSELAEQAANGTYSASQRASANTEFQALVREFGRTGDTASFNGLSLLLAGRTGKVSQFDLQTGIDGSSSSNLRIGTANTGTLSGSIYASQLFGNSTALAAYGGFTFDAIASSYQGQIASLSLTDSSNTKRTLLIGVDYQQNGEYLLRVFAKNSDLGATGYLIGGENPVGSPENYTYMGDIAVNVDSSGRSLSTSVSSSFQFNEETTSGTLVVDVSGLTFQRVGTPVAFQVSSTNNSGSTALDFSGVETIARARAALTLIEARRGQLSILQGQIGAAQSRLESTLRVSSASQENSLAAESRIRDADIASEMAQLTAAQIRQQVSSRLLAQTNDQTRLALQLLQL